MSNLDVKLWGDLNFEDKLLMRTSFLFSRKLPERIQILLELSTHTIGKIRILCCSDSMLKGQ